MTKRISKGASALVTVLILGAVLSGLASCSKGSSSAAAGATGPAEGAIVVTDGMALVLAPEAGLYTVADGKATRSGSVPRGSVIVLVDPKEAPVEAIDEGGSTARFANFRVPGGNQAFLSLSTVGMGAKAVLVGDKVAPYTEAKTTKASGSYLSGATMVAASTEGVPAGFAAVAYWDAASGAVVNAFVVRKDVTDRADDLKAADFLARAAADPAKAKDILEEAQKALPSSAFAGQMAAELARLASQPSSAKVIGRYEVVSDNVSVRDNPDAVFGAVVGTLDKGGVVEAIEIAEKEETVEGATGHWTKIAKPEGWVFGADLKERK